MGKLRKSVLGRARPANTGNTTVSIDPGLITSVFITNTTATAATFRIFLDDSNVGFSQLTALFYDTSVLGNTTVEIETNIPVRAGNQIAVRSSIADNITFTFVGEIED